MIFQIETFDSDALLYNIQHTNYNVVTRAIKHVFLTKTTEVVAIQYIEYCLSIINSINNFRGELLEICFLFCNNLKQQNYLYYINKLQSLDDNIIFQRSNQTQSLWFFAKGCLSYILQNYIITEKYFKQFCELYTQPIVNTSWRNGGCFYSAPKSLTKKDCSIDIKHYKISDINSEYVVLVSCDMGYLLEYSLRFYEVSKSYSPDCLIHFHIINPNFALLENVSLIKEKDVSITYEFINHKKQLAAYYASSRFLVCKNILSLYCKNVIVCDIDVQILEPFENALKQTKNDLGLSVAGRDFFPWKKVRTFSVFPNNQISINFLKELETFFNSHFNENKECWFIDQSGLEYAYRSTNDNLNVERNLVKFKISQPNNVEYKKNVQHIRKTYNL